MSYNYHYNPETLHVTHITEANKGSIVPQNAIRLDEKFSVEGKGLILKRNANKKSTSIKDLFDIVGDYRNQSVFNEKGEPYRMETVGDLPEGHTTTEPEMFDNVEEVAEAMTFHEAQGIQQDKAEDAIVEELINIVLSNDTLKKKNSKAYTRLKVFRDYRDKKEEKKRAAHEFIVNSRRVHNAQS